MVTCRMSPQLALDRAASDRNPDSLRSVDLDGHLKVAESRISKANICPYRGEEIPEYQKLGLQPTKIYKLYRDPIELAKAAKTFEGKPLLIRHKGVSAVTPSRELWVGSTGQVFWEPPYLISRPLSVWTQEAIDLIESGEREELSSAYRYRADMTPGLYDGEAYDGVMRDISGNHVAIVSEGRAGPDVHVADELPAELSMKKTPKILEKAALLLRGENPSAIDVRLAFDAALGETPAKSVMSLDASERKAAEDKARDAKRARGSDEELTEAEKEEAYDEACDSKEDEHDKAEDAADAADAAEEKDDADAEDRKRARDARKGARDKRAADRKGARDSAGKNRAQNMDAKRGKDALPDKEDHRQDFRSEDSVTKDEMDAAIKVAIAETKKRERSAAQAREAVRPVVGAVDLAMDSAESIYRFALESQGVDLAGVPESAFAALYGAARKISTPAPRLAMDSSGAPVDRRTLLGLN